MTHWQVGYSLAKSGYPAARDAGVEPSRAFVAEYVPWLADRVGQLRDFGADDAALGGDQQGGAMAAGRVAPDR